MTANKDKPVIILGTGGHAKVLIEALRMINRKIIGLTDPVKEINSLVLGVKVLGDDEVLFSYSPNEIALVNGLGALPGKTLRWDLAEKFRQQGFNFATVIHPSTIMAKGVQLGEGVQIMAGSILQPGVVIGVDSIVNTGVIIDHDCMVGEKCHLAPGVILSGGVCIGSRSHIGTGASIIQALNIGSEVVVAAGSTVYQPISDGEIFIQHYSHDKN